MVDIPHTQKRIINLVKLYKRMFPEEYKLVCESVIQTRKKQNDEFATVKGEHNAMSAQRALFELPEKLYTSIVNTLDPHELMYYKSRDGARWFSKTFKEFSLQRYA